MEVIKKWNAHPNELKEWGEEIGWFNTTLEDAIKHLEGSGYWREGSVKEMLESGQEVWNPFATYKKKE